MGDTERFWGDTGKSGGDTERIVEGLGKVQGRSIRRNSR
jgi:hypothetical protein